MRPTGLQTLELVPFIGNLCCLCVFLSVSPFYSPLILKPDMIRNSFQSMFLNTLLEKALREQAVKEILRNSRLWKRVIAWERSRAASGYGIIWGDADRTNKEEFSAECNRLDWF